MDFRKLASGLAAMGLTMALTACEHADVSINGEKGKPLSDIDLTHGSATSLVLMGPDTVRVHKGDKLAIHVEGDKSDVLRFTLKDNTLGILRKPGVSSNDDQITIDVTMPAPTEVTMGGSGKITSETLAPAAKVSIAGSGNIDGGALAADKLEVNIAGTGNFRATGTAKVLDINIAGTGRADLAGLKVDKAKIAVAGTGDASLASDGEVKADIMGTGSIHVRGRAKCEVNAMGPGKLVCEP